MLYVNFTVTTKEKFIENTQKKVRKEPKHNTKQSYQTTGKREKKGAERRKE